MQISWRDEVGSYGGGSVKVLGSWCTLLVVVGWMVDESAGFTTGSTYCGGGFLRADVSSVGVVVVMSLMVG